jgi:hypothetical protein
MGSRELHTYLFQGLAGQSVILETHGNLDLTMALYSPAGSMLSANDDGGVNGNSRITWNLAESGTYHVEVEGYSSSETGPYSISLDVQ